MEEVKVIVCVGHNVILRLGLIEGRSFIAQQNPTVSQAFCNAKEFYQHPFTVYIFCCLLLGHGLLGSRGDSRVHDALRFVTRNLHEASIGPNVEDKTVCFPVILGRELSGREKFVVRALKLRSMMAYFS